MKPSWVIVVCLCSVLMVSAKRPKSAGSRGGGRENPVTDIIDIDNHDETALDSEASGMGSDVTEDEESDNSDMSGDGTEEISGGGPNELISCQQLRAKSSAKPMRPGQYIPECSPEGHFKPTQCHASTGECWCVDQYSGEELSGSRRQASQKPNCSPSSAGTVTVSTTTTTVSFERPASTASKFLMKTPSASTSTQTSVKTSASSASTSTTRPASSSTVRYTTTTRTSTVVPTTTTRSNDPDNKINQIPNEPGPGVEVEVDGPDTENNYVERSNVIVEPKARKMTLRSTIVGQPGILAGIIGAAVVLLLCLVLLVMFIIYRMHRKSQDPAIYYIDKPSRSSLPSSNKKAGYMKALDHDVYT